MYFDLSQFTVGTKMNAAQRRYKTERHSIFMKKYYAFREHAFRENEFQTRFPHILHSEIGPSLL